MLKLSAALCGFAVYCAAVSAASTGSGEPNAGNARAMAIVSLRNVHGALG
ncbi:MAG: hypothetical protein NTX38_05640 [Methylobacter sp.]|nr:hypothetical protein [Methylobacter sp.]